MSIHTIRPIPVQPNEVRDFYDIDESANAYTRDLWTRDGVIGLDWSIRAGPAPVTVTLDGLTMTVPANGSAGWSNIKFAIITTSAAQHTLIIAGVQKRRIR